jgi:hypothetical protein
MNQQITKPVHAYEQTATSITIRWCFQRARLYPDTESRLCRFRFDEESLRTSQGFQEIWAQNIKIGELTQRRSLYAHWPHSASFSDREIKRGHHIAPAQHVGVFKIPKPRHRAGPKNQYGKEISQFSHLRSECPIQLGVISRAVQNRGRCLTNAEPDRSAS